MKNHLGNNLVPKKRKNHVPKEVKIVLYLYLMTRETDYGSNIYEKFMEAKEAGKWTDRRGLGDLKYENKIGAALKQMEKCGLIYKSTDIKNKIPDDCYFDKNLEEHIQDEKRSHYYSINPRVIIYSTKNTDTPDYNDGVRFNPHFLMYSEIYRGLRFIQTYKKDEIETIALINRLPKFDNLTILTTLIWIFQDAIDHYPNKPPLEADIALTFFNKPKYYAKLLRYVSSEWKESDMLDFLIKIKNSLEKELIHTVYTERAIT